MHSTIPKVETPEVTVQVGHTQVRQKVPRLAIHMPFEAAKCWSGCKVLVFWLLCGFVQHACQVTS